MFERVFPIAAKDIYDLAQSDLLLPPLLRFYYVWLNWISTLYWSLKKLKVIFKVFLCLLSHWSLWLVGLRAIMPPSLGRTSLYNLHRNTNICNIFTWDIWPKSTICFLRYCTKFDLSIFTPSSYTHSKYMELFHQPLV